jgi:hypothetical protein
MSGTEPVDTQRRPIVVAATTFAAAVLPVTIEETREIKRAAVEPNKSQLTTTPARTFLRVFR